MTAPFTPSEARAFIGVLLPRLYVSPMLATVVLRWAELAEQHSVKGADIFDVQLVATMLENGSRRIYTYNRSDFEPFSALAVVTP